MQATAFLTIVGCAILSAANPLKTRERPLDISVKYLGRLAADRDAAENWKIAKAELVTHALHPHLAIKLTISDIPIQSDGSNNPIVYEEEAEDRLTGFALHKGPVTLQTFGYFEKPIASIKKPKDLLAPGKPPLSLGRLLECVDGAPMTRDTDGRCLILAARVLRFLAGACQCKLCGAEDNGDFMKIPSMTASQRGLFKWDKAGVTYFAGTIQRLANLGASGDEIATALDKVPKWLEGRKAMTGLQPRK